ncbi:hypothetical protein SO694_00042026 [Aureococcus anophagefferens]|uniref:Uncharacterized protein n=1 Tax=Aureococcus anophagefferens TaxID=44056 RepID=A0ABR1G736_AURAN
MLRLRAELNAPTFAVCPQPSGEVSDFAFGAAAFLSAPTFAVWCLAFLNAKPAWRKDDDAAEGGMENDMNAAL